MSRDIAVIRHDIEQTRGRLRDTAEAIGWKADVPSRARDILRESAALVRERVAAGSTPPPSRGEGGPSVTERIGNAASAVADRVGGTASAVGGAVGSAVSAVGSGAESVAGSVSSAGSTVGGAASSAKDAVAHGVSAAAEGAQSAAEHAPDPGLARQGARRVARGARANPVAIAAGALALGAVAGLLLPSTRVEDERLGHVADDVKEGGAELAQEAIDRSREATRAVADSDVVGATANGGGADPDVRE